MRPSVLLAALLIIAATVGSLLILLRGGAGNEDPRPQAPPLRVESAERDGRDANRGEAGIYTAAFIDSGRGEAVSGCLRGRVLALVDGHPVAAATIRTTARSSQATPSLDFAEPAATTTSAADGRFSVVKLPLASPLTIQVTHPEFGYATLEGISLAARAPDRDLGVLLLDLRRSLRGRVRDASGRPIAGAELRAGGGRRAIGVVPGALPSSPLDACRTRSDGDGCYTLEGLAPGFHWVEAAHPDHATAVRGPIRVPREGPVPELDIAMSEARKLRGIVVDPDGRGIPGARIVPTIIETRYLGREGAALVRPWHRHAVTDSEGRCALGPLPDLEEIELQLEVDAEGKARANATVCRTPEGRPLTQTGPDGVFLLRDLPVGEVQISILIEDRPSWRRDVRATFSEVTEIGEIRIP